MERNKFDYEEDWDDENDDWDDEDDDWDDEDEWAPTDINGNLVEVGMSVRRHDLAIDDFSEEEMKIQQERVWTVVDIAGDALLITDGGDEAMVFVDEIEVV